GGPDKPARTTSTAAVASLILGFLGFVFWIFTAVPAIIVALVAKSDIRANPTAMRGSGLATIGLLMGLISLFMPFFWIFFFVALLAGAPTAVTYDDGQRIAHIHLAGPLLETPTENLAGFYLQSANSLKGLVELVERAAEDDSVEALLFTTGAQVMGYGQLEELVAAIETFKASGKKVFAHGTALQTGSYTLLSSATHLNVVPTDTVWLAGISLSEFHLKDALEKIGLEADVIQMGTYKAAGEMLTRSEPSDAARANSTWLIDGLYESLVDLISESRGMPPERVMEIIDEGPFTAERALEVGLVDSVMFLDQFLEEIRNEYGEDVYIDNYYGHDDAGGGLSLMEELLSQRSGADTQARGEAVAVVYVEGTILQGYGGVSPFGVLGAFSGDLVKLLDRAAADDSVQAVVMRIDSPGGSAVASEEILRAAERVQDKKPFIVSMGSPAASGGYYIACKADAIFADEMTITASIGVIGGKLVTTGMWDRLGVNWTVYSRGENAGIFSGDHHFTESERAWVRSYMEETYDVFTGHVTQGRGDKLSKPIDEMAGGRVYTGKQALDLGLIDEIGGLSDAIEFAAERAGLEDYDVRVLPEPMSFFQQLMDSLTGLGERSSDLHFEAAAVPNRAPSMRRLFDGAQPSLAPAAAVLDLFDAEGSRAVMNALSAIEVIRREGVAVIMPETFVIR
ncbi:MAG: signal peptide peptidase SppA, partial [Candidatus Hydrogenedentes bacterium]|nr:signal peptide peptidase SppA [Candidatus Hydrogenedentota bacterium]